MSYNAVMANIDFIKKVSDLGLQLVIIILQMFLIKLRHLKDKDAEYELLGNYVVLAENAPKYE